MNKKRLELRAHHGLCFNFFEGKGYSEEFTKHMQSVYDAMKNNPDLKVVIKEDIICQKCPNLLKGVCKTKELVQGYDHIVLSFCGLKENSQISWFEFSRLINEKIIIPDQRKSICGNCQSTEICERKA